MFLIVGLGNPTKEYENTYHNMGFRAVDTLATSLGKSIKKAECSALTVVFSRGGERVILAKPMTYMNASGEAVKSLMAKYKVSADELIVIYDDIDIDRFTLRARAYGSAGTHNGMKSIVASIGTEHFKRVRVGIGREGYDLADYVLSQIKDPDNKIFDEHFALLAQKLQKLLKDCDFEAFMREVNIVK